MIEMLQLVETIKSPDNIVFGVTSCVERHFYIWSQFICVQIRIIIRPLMCFSNK